MFRTVIRIDDRKRRDFMSTTQGALSPRDITMKYEMTRGRIVYQDLSSSALSTNSYENAVNAWKSLGASVSRKVAVKGLAKARMYAPCEWEGYSSRAATLVRRYQGWGDCGSTAYPNERLQFYYWADKPGVWSLYDCLNYYDTPTSDYNYYRWRGLCCAAIKFGTATYYQQNYYVDYEDYDKWPIVSITLEEPGLIPVNMFISCREYSSDLSYRFYIAHESDPFYKSRDLDFSRCYITPSLLKNNDIE